MHIAIATSSDYPEGAPEDQPLRDALSVKGVRYRHEVWDRFNAGFDRYDAVVVRSVWDYALKRDRFLRWARDCGACTPLFNPPDVLRWNSHKSYLIDFSSSVPVIETRCLEAYSVEELHRLALDMGSGDVIAKPAVGAGAHGIVRLDIGWPESRLERILADLAKVGDYLVQPFVDSITSRGESSAIWFHGRYSHGTRKLPADGDFRVQIEHGGSMVSHEPTPNELSFCEAVLERVGEDVPLYARIDWLPGDDGGPLLGEVELIEPSLYWNTEPRAAGRFVDALIEKVQR